MASPSIYLALLFVLGILASHASSRSVPEVSISNGFEEWISSYGRVYQDASEKDKRFQIFGENLEYIESHNADTSKKYKLGVNEFTNLSNQEFKSMRNIEARLQRVVVGVGAAPSLPLSMEGQARRLIAEAVSHTNLGNMYIWWMPWF